MKPKLSIIIVSFNTKNLLRQTIESILESEANGSFFEIIVVDNNSKDGSREMMMRDFSKARLIASPKNLGFAKANNLGSQKARGKYLLFLNSDTIVQSGVLSKMVKFLEKNQSVGILGPKLILESGKVQPYCVGYESDLVQIFKNKFANILSCFGISGSFLAKLSLEYWNWSRSREVDWVTGAALMIRKDLFEELKGYDANFFMYFEDQDLCLRAKKLGYKTWVLVGLKIIHLGGKSFQFDAKRKKLYYQSQDYFLRKQTGKSQYWFWRVISFPYRLFFLIKLNRKI